MNYEIFKVIKSKHYKWNRIQCQNFVNKYIDKLQLLLPRGIPENQYFVVPGYEHVTRFQPIIIFNASSKLYELSSTTKFFTPIKIKENKNATEEKTSESTD